VQGIVKHVGSTIRAFRKTQKLSRENLAERAGLHPNYVGAVERGEMNAGVENLAKIAKALKIPLYRLFLHPETKPDPVFDELLAIAGTADHATLTLMTDLLQAVKMWQERPKRGAGKA
jgi:transcriptional regulator with XRE-family HTH domain